VPAAFAAGAPGVAVTPHEVRDDRNDHTAPVPAEHDDAYDENNLRPSARRGDRMSNRYACCKCCDGVAKDDHVEHGGTVERNGHEGPCSTCEFEEHIRPRLAEAWDRGWNQGTHDAWQNGGHESEPNPWRTSVLSPDGGRA
jgi:hypothetical protein